MSKAPFTKFRLMIWTSALAMYGVMYANVYEFSHVYTATMRIYMTALMIVPMIIIMLGFMRSMYPNTNKKIWIIWGSLVFWVWILLAVRTQFWIEDVQWMKAMIPHHSSAILTSSRADLQDKRVQQLADNIIQAQREEIEVMKSLLNELD